MKTKRFAKIMFYMLNIGWFCFMFVAFWASWNRQVGAYVAIIGVVFCALASSNLIMYFEDDELFKTIEELNAEKFKYQQARKRLERKIEEL